MPRAKKADGPVFADGPHTAPLVSVVSARITASAYAAIQRRAMAENVSDGAVLRRWLRAGYYLETGKNLEMAAFE
jgi:hypothetical protein